MSENNAAWAEALKDIASLQTGDWHLVWITATTTAGADLRWQGCEGWLRLDHRQDEEGKGPNLIAASKLPACDARGVLAGEWVHENGSASTSISCECGLLKARTIRETDENSAKSIPVLRKTMTMLTRSTPSRAASGPLEVANYFGFRNQADFEAGLTTCIAERLTALDASEKRK